MASSPSDSSPVLPILLIEDNPGDARLVEETLSNPKQAEALHKVSTGDAALDFLHQRGEHDDAPRPRLILLDWHLPDTEGEEILSELNKGPELRQIPVIVLTGSQSEQDVRDAYANQANACITKASGPDELTSTIEAFEEFWLSAARLPSFEDE
ncbi:response regulator [Natrialba sp. SSL1]|uniref:response regulator n=1 Tax=Natrialba sp. SSL1 TaxID=1869245 RepID=UPI000A06EF8E|nr:response regulator [Natrialba sp. SSL1]